MPNLESIKPLDQLVDQCVKPFKLRIPYPIFPDDLSGQKLAIGQNGDLPFPKL